MTDTSAYRVLARKYRPETFADLVGQDAMVRTLKNAFAADRIAKSILQEKTTETHVEIIPKKYGGN